MRPMLAIAPRTQGNDGERDHAAGKVGAGVGHTFCARTKRGGEIVGEVVI